MATECYWLRSQILCADSPKVLRLKSKQRYTHLYTHEKRQVKLMVIRTLKILLL